MRRLDDRCHAGLDKPPPMSVIVSEDIELSYCEVATAAAAAGRVTR
jgi:hypothetical protein